MTTTGPIAFIFSLGIFLFGIKFLSFHIRSLFNKELYEKIEYWTRNKLRSFLTGMALITVTQSVVAIIIIMAGLIKKNIVSKKNVIPILWGVNLGTCISIFLVSLNITAAVMLMLGMGGILYAFAKVDKTKSIAASLFAIGCIYYGLHSIQFSVSNLTSLKAEGLFTIAKNAYFIDFFIAALFTFISSSGLSVVVMAVALVKADLFGMQELMMIVYGSNVGNALLVYTNSLMARGEIRQITTYQVIYKMIGAVVLVPLFYIEQLAGVPLVGSLIKNITVNPGGQGALIYFVFNAIPLMFILPWQNKLLAMIERWYPKSWEDIYSRPQFIIDTKDVDPYVVIDLIELEQIRIIKTFTIYFDEMRQRADPKVLSALTHSAEELSLFIKDEISHLVKKADLSSDNYQKINGLLINQNTINQCYTALIPLSNMLLKLKMQDRHKQFYQVVVESIDIIALMLLDIVDERDPEDLKILKTITASESGGISKMREIYLKTERGLTGQDRSDLLIIINYCEIIVFLFVDLAEQFCMIPPSTLAKGTADKGGIEQRLQ